MNKNNTPTIMSYTIDCLGTNGSMPDPTKDSNKIILITSTFNIYGEQNPYHKHVITLNTCNLIDDVIVESYNTEKQVILAWIRLINKMDPDVIINYGCYEYNYLIDRSKKLGIYNSFSKLHKEKKISETIINKLPILKTNDKYIDYTISGRAQINLLKLFTIHYKMLSYKLDYVVQEVLNVKFDRISPTVIRELQNSSPKIVKNSLQECMMYYKLMEKLS